MSEPTLPLAIGIRPGNGRGRTGSEIALIGSDPELRNHPSVEAAIRRSRGEARFYYGGKPEFQSIWDPARVRPLRLGLSVARTASAAGTLGACVTLADGTIGILSNNHVLAGLGQAPIGDGVVQPAAQDGGTEPADLVAKLAKFVPLDLSPGAINHVDCAVARLEETVEPCATFATHEVEAPVLKGVATGELFLDDPLWKVGRTTGMTHGKVFAIEVDNYIIDVGSALKPQRIRFDDQIQVYADDRSFSSRGDSGALVVDRNGLACGLLFAGAAAGGPANTGLTTVNPIGAVLNGLGAKLWIG